MDQHKIPEAVLQLLEHPHIPQLHAHPSQPSTYILAYTPSSTQSTYKSQTYHLQLYIPEQYPESGPTLKFLQQIYHLNIGYYSGEVRMPVLEDDWSTFLTLTAVIQSLDRVLEYPEEDYAVEEDVLQLWINDRNKYYQKVIENVKLCRVVLCESAQRKFQPSNNDSPIKAIQSKRTQDISSKLVSNLRKSMQFIDLQQVQFSSKQRQQIESEQNIFPQMIKAQSRQSLKAENRHSEHNEYRHHASNRNKIIIEDDNEINSMPVSVAPQKNAKNQKYGDGLESGENRTLKNINQTIGIFIQEINYLEKQMEVAKNKSIVQLLKQKCQNQMELLRELLELSEEAKRKVINKFRHEINKI